LSARVVIKIAQPRGSAQTWGDFYYAYSLKNALRLFGRKARVSFADDLTVPARAEVVLLGINMQHYRPPPDAISVAWLISHPDANTPDVLRRYRKAFVDPVYQCSAPRSAPERPSAPYFAVSAAAAHATECESTSASSHAGPSTSNP
jgi:hypothetical protein